MIRELVIISGKGGTGKTSVAASLASLAENKVIADCDVDAADLHIALGAAVSESGSFTGGKKAYVASGLCDGCGLCIDLCRADAINAPCSIDLLACEGCGVCARFCPRGAIRMEDHVSGEWFVSATRHGTLVHARLGIAEGNSGRLVTWIRKKAMDLAKEQGNDLILIDGSPGIGCPVIATLTGASFVLIVTEPTVSGIHDLGRIHDLTRHFRLKSAVCVNRADINPEKAREIGEYCCRNGIPLIAEVPYDGDVIRAQVAGRSVMEYSNGPAAAGMKKLWEVLLDSLPR